MKFKKDWGFIVLILFSTLLIFWRINDRYVAFTDELLFEEASYQIAFPNQGQRELPRWLIPKLGNQVWLEKPPLYFWMTSLIFNYFNKLKSIYPLTDAVTSGGEFIYPWIRRFWTDVAGVAIVGLIYGIAKLLFRHKGELPLTPSLAKRGDIVGILAGVLLLASPLFLATTKSASLDLTATMWMTGAVYFYLKGEKTRGIIYQLLTGTFIGLGIMTRSFLALTPIAVILLYEITNPVHLRGAALIDRFKGVTPPRWFNAPWQNMGLIILVILLVSLPWHWYMWQNFRSEFVQVYLGFNLVEHAVNLTPGYEQTQLWFYLLGLIKNVPWLLPVLIAGGLFITYEKSLKDKMDSRSPLRSTSAKQGLRGNDAMRRNNNIQFLLIWLLAPLVILSILPTRHEWYAVQLMPPLAILMAMVISRTYQALKACQSCRLVKYLAEMTLATFLLASIISVLTAPDPSATTVQIVRWLRVNTPTSVPVYVYKYNYLPETLLFHPKSAMVIQKPALVALMTQDTKIYLYVDQSETDQIRLRFPQLKLIKQWDPPAGGGGVYTNQDNPAAFSAAPGV